MMSPRGWVVFAFAGIHLHPSNGFGGCYLLIIEKSQQNAYWREALARYMWMMSTVDLAGVRAASVVASRGAAG